MTPSPRLEPPTIATVGVHVLDIHVVGIESIPAGSDGALVQSIGFSAAGTAGGTALVLSRLGATVRTHGAIGDDTIGRSLTALLDAEGVDTGGLVPKPGVQTSSSVIPVRPNGDRPAWHCIEANAQFTLDDLGVTHLRGKGRGDLKVHFEVETPKDLSSEQRELLEQLAELRGEEAADGTTVNTNHSGGFFSRLRDRFNDL